MAHMTLKRVIDRSTGTPSSLAIVSCQTCSLLDGITRNLTSSSFDNHMCTSDATSMQPDIIASSLMKRNIFVLATILTDQERKTFLALNIQWHTTTGGHRFALSWFTP